MPCSPDDRRSLDRRTAPVGDPSSARALQAHRHPGARLRRGAALAVELVDGCDHAGVTLASRWKQARRATPWCSAGTRGSTS